MCVHKSGFGNSEGRGLVSGRLRGGHRHNVVTPHEVGRGICV